MLDSEAKVSGPGIARKEYLDQAVAALEEAGVRLAFPERVAAAQARWPEDCPLSDEELRAELLDLRAEIARLASRAKALHDRLPEPRELEREDPNAVPESLYFTLLGALDAVFDDGLKRSMRVLDRALAATPEGIRAAWLERQLPAVELRRLIPHAGDG